MVQYEAAQIDLEPGASKAYAPKIYSLDAAQLDLEPGSSKAYAPKVSSLISIQLDLELGSSQQMDVGGRSFTGTLLDTFEGSLSHYKPDYIRSSTGILLDTFGEPLTHYKPDYIRSLTGTEFLVLYGLKNASQDLHNFFHVGQDSRSLHNFFHVGQDSRNLFIKFETYPEEELFIKFVSRHSSILDLSSEFHVGQDSKNLHGVFIVKNLGNLNLSVKFELQSSSSISGRMKIRHTVPEWIYKEAEIDFTDTWDPIGYSVQRKSFQAHGLIWIIYYSNLTSTFYYKTSRDGINWSPASIFRNPICRTGEFLAIFFDGIYVHYCSGSLDLYYRRGKPKPDGSIDWSAAEQIAESHGVSTNAYYYPNIGVDKDGYPFIIYNLLHGPVFSGCRITKSNTNDGTWVTQTGFPYQFSSLSRTFYCSIIPLPSGKICAMYGYSSILPTEDLLKVEIWDGTSWSSEGSVGRYHYSAVNEGEIIHLVYQSTIGEDAGFLLYRRREVDGTWGIEQFIHTVGNIVYPAIGIDNEGVIWAFWEKNDKIYYKTYIAGEWSALNEYPTHYDRVSSWINGPMCFRNAWKRINLFYFTEFEHKLYGLTFDYFVPELRAVFHIGRGSTNLKAVFRLTQEDLPAETRIRHTAPPIEIKVSFTPRYPAAATLPAEANIVQYRSLKAIFKTRRIYNFVGATGIIFYWQGAGGWDQLVDFEMFTPTGSYVAKFPDGPPGLRIVALKFGEELTAVSLNGTWPDLSKVMGLIWTYHSVGLRKLGKIWIWRGPSELFAKFIVNHP